MANIEREIKKELERVKERKKGEKKCVIEKEEMDRKIGNRER